MIGRPHPAATRRSPIPDSSTDRNPRTRRRAVSLLEVILALAILAGALAAIGELVRVGVRHASAAQDISAGQLHCQSIMDQLSAGVLPMGAAADVPLALDPEWLYSIEVQSQTLQGLMRVTVAVRRDEPRGSSEPLAVLVQLVVDPAYLQQVRDEAQALLEGQAGTESGDAGA